MRVDKEVLDLLFEFLISILIIGGGGVLMAFGLGDNAFLTAMMGVVIVFWFQSRSNASAINNLLKQPPITPPILQDPGAIQPPQDKTL